MKKANTTFSLIYFLSWPKALISIQKFLLQNPWMLHLAQTVLQLPFLYCVICLWFIISFARMFMRETLGAVTDASSCPRSAQRFGRRVAGQIYVCGWKAGALCWGRETVLWHPWGKYSGQGDWPRLSLSLSVSIKSRLSPQGCLPRAHILPTDLLAISVANGPAIPVNDVVLLSEREREIVCVKEFGSQVNMLASIR